MTNMQIPPTKSEYIAIYTPYIVIFIPRWQHTMAIFTTLRLTVVLSTILPHTTDRILQLFCWIARKFLPISKAVSIAQDLRRLTSNFRANFVVLGGFSAASLLPRPAPLSAPCSSVVCPPLCLRLSWSPSAAQPTLLST